MAFVIILEVLVFAGLHVSPASMPANDIPNDMSSVFLFIFTQNMKCALFTILCGTIPMGLGVILNIYLTITNLVSIAKYLLLTMSAGELILKVLPHGIFEITAIYFSVLLSILWCSVTTRTAIQLIRKKIQIKDLRNDIIVLLKGVTFVLIPLILIAAFIESMYFI